MTRQGTVPGARQGAQYTKTGPVRNLPADQSPYLLYCHRQVLVDYHSLAVGLGQAQDSLLESNQASQLGIGEGAARMIRAKNP